MIMQRHHFSAVEGHVPEIRDCRNSPQLENEILGRADHVPVCLPCPDAEAREGKVGKS